MRSDILVSVGMVDAIGPVATLPTVAALNAALAEDFRYFEILYVVPESRRIELDAVAGQFAKLSNVRLIVATESTHFYRQRLVAAMEAIGDVVALFDPGELSPTELAKHIIAAKDEEAIHIGWRSRSGNKPSYQLLSLASRNLVSARAGRTIILPREQLNALLDRPSAALDLRFEPRSPRLTYRRFGLGAAAMRSTGIAHRYALFVEILIAGAPRYLKAYAAAGFVVSVGALVYALYAVATLLLRDDVARGWFSSAVTQAGSTAFIAIGMSILSISLVAVIESLTGGNDRLIADELSNTSFFDVSNDRNVELSDETEHATGTHDRG